MARHSLEQALILNSRQIGEDNRIIITVSIYATIFPPLSYNVYEYFIILNLFLQLFIVII